MGENSKIEWCDMTFNPWRGCTKVSPGCKNCYAETLSKRNPAVLGEWGAGRPRVLASEDMWSQPVKWNRLAERDGVRKRVFCASLADWLDPEVPAEWLARLLKLIRATPWLDWLLLTKRPEGFAARMREAYLAANRNFDSDVADWVQLWALHGATPYNVWFGVSVEDQRRADERMAVLVKIPAAVRFLSCEPLLEEISLRKMRHDNDWDPPAVVAGIDWVIVGGESGSLAREFDLEWARVLRDDCRAAGVAFFMKQMGARAYQSPRHDGGTGYFIKYHDRKGGDPNGWPVDLRVREFPKTKKLEVAI